MTVARITKSVVDWLLPGAVLWDTEVLGFGVRAGKAKHYLLRFRFQGRQTFKRIGTHGSPFTPETARKEARRLLGLIASGVNPSVKPTKGIVFLEQAERYLAARSRDAKPATLRQMQYHLRTLAAPLHPLTLVQIDRRRIAELLAQVELGSGPAQRNRFRANLSACWNWLVREGLLDVNVVAGTGTATENISRSRVLSEEELRKLWAALGSDGWSDIIRLLLFTAQRRDEIGALAWNEVDLARKMIVLPPARVKNKRQHELPLSHQALTILKRQSRRNDTDFLFGAKRGFLNWSDSKAALDKRVGIAEWRLHDLRRSAATGMAELGTQAHIIEAVLNHVSGHKAGVAGIYNRARYEGEMRAALQRWGDHLDHITGA